jgi:hypothetical protein
LVGHEVGVKIPIALLALALSGSVAVAASIPLPRPRPGPPATAAVDPATAPDKSKAASADDAKPGDAAKTADAPAEKPADKPAVAAGPPPPSPCQVALKAIAEFAVHTPVKGSGACGITDPVTLEAVMLPDNVRVPINPPAVLRCDMATAVSTWIRDEAAPVAAKLGSPLRGIENYDSYDCRGRNRVVGAKMSEHGRGNALDIKGLKLENGVVAHLTDTHVSKDVRNDLRKSACDRFMTVLGPGSDGYHESHVHLDLAVRSNDYRICQWEVRQPMDRAAPSPHIASSRAPTPHEMMPSITVMRTSDANTTPVPRHAAKRR